MEGSIHVQLLALCPSAWLWHSSVVFTWNPTCRPEIGSWNRNRSHCDGVPGEQRLDDARSFQQTAPRHPWVHVFEEVVSVSCCHALRGGGGEKNRGGKRAFRFPHPQRSGFCCLLILFGFFSVGGTQGEEKEMETEARVGLDYQQIYHWAASQED